MPYSWMLALKFAVRFGKFDLYTRKSFASTLITSQTDKCQGECESYQMVGSDMNLDHSTSCTLLHVCTLKWYQLLFLLNMQLMGSGSLCNQLLVQEPCLHLKFISWGLPWLKLTWQNSYSWIVQTLPYLLPSLSLKQLHFWGRQLVVLWSVASPPSVYTLSRNTEQ